MTAALVPELYVRDLDRSLAFYCATLGFSIVYQRPEERFVYLEREGVFADAGRLPAGRVWLAGPLEVPYGRGINLQIAVADAAALLRCGAGGRGAACLRPRRADLSARR